MVSINEVNKSLAISLNSLATPYLEALDALIDEEEGDIEDDDDEEEEVEEEEVDEQEEEKEEGKGNDDGDLYRLLIGDEFSESDSDGSDKN